MPQRDTIHNLVKQAILKDGWVVTDDPYVISYGERFLFVDLGARELEVSDIKGQFIGAERGNNRIALEIKDFRSQSVITDLERAIGQYVLYHLLLKKVDPEREIYLAITDLTYDEIFNEPIGKLVISDLPLKLLVVDVEKVEVKQWIPPRTTPKSSNR
ncbi:MAG: XisH family protein [Oscillatoria sp. PMC 1068.18]|nr:XisH family protein [Oscillatoria sp. PMC 1076.18]MEC4991773.1 XisH family protein [Oscillatoria sp. PMC 1068.18]